MSDFDTIARRFKAFTNSIGTDQTERAVSGMLTAVGAHTNPLIPVATSKMINSQVKNVRPGLFGWQGEISYGAGYALFVHEAPGTLMGTRTPRSPASLGFVWDPTGEPKFLQKGAALAVSKDADKIISGSYIL